MSTEHKYVPGYGSLGASIVILGDCPSYEDTIAGKSFSKMKELRELLLEAGIDPASCWYTTVCKYTVRGNLKGKKIPFPVRCKQQGIDIGQHLQELQVELNSLKPNLVIAIGNTALWALSGKLGIQDYRGSILYGMGCKFIPTYNPRHLSWQAEDVEFIGYWNRQVILHDLRRCAEEAQSKELKLPQRTLHIARNSYDLYEFKRQYAKGFTELSVDIESAGSCIPVCVGLAFNRKHGITIPLWNQDGISTIPTSDLVNCWRILAEMLWEFNIIGQNFNYDRDKLKRLGFIIRFLKSDTMMKAFAINPELPKGLAFNTSIYTREPFYKNEGMYEGKLEDLFIGCARDACVTKEIDEEMDADIDELKLRSFYETFLMHLPELYLEIENNGFGINEERRIELLRKYISWDERNRYELFKLVGCEVNVNSHKQVAELLFNTLKCPIRAGTGEEELSSLLNLQTFTDPIKRRVVELVLETRRVRKTVSTNLMALPDFDGRMKTTCFPCLETGRSSTGMQDPPIRPDLEIIDENGKKKKKSLGFAFQTMTKHGDIGQDVRSMFIPIGNL